MCPGCAALPAAGRERRAGPELQPLHPKRTPSPGGGRRGSSLLSLALATSLVLARSLLTPPTATSARGERRIPSTPCHRSTALGALSAPQTGAERCGGFHLPPCSPLPEPGISSRGWRGQKGTFIFCCCLCGAGGPPCSAPGQALGKGCATNPWGNATQMTEGPTATAPQPGCGVPSTQRHRSLVQGAPCASCPLPRACPVPFVPRKARRFSARQPHFPDLLSNPSCFPSAACPCLPHFPPRWPRAAPRAARPQHGERPRCSLLHQHRPPNPKPLPVGAKCSPPGCPFPHPSSSVHPTVVCSQPVPARPVPAFPVGRGSLPASPKAVTSLPFPGGCS